MKKSAVAEMIGSLAGNQLLLCSPFRIHLVVELVFSSIVFIDTLNEPISRFSLNK